MYSYCLSQIYEGTCFACYSLENTPISTVCPGHIVFFQVLATSVCKSVDCVNQSKRRIQKKIGTDHHSFIISGVDVTKDWCLVHCSFCCLYLMLFSVYVHTPPGQPHDQWSVINYHHLPFSARKKMDTMRQQKQNVNKTKRAMGDKGKQTLQSLYSATRSCSYFGWSCIIIVYCSIIATYSQET